MLQAPARPTMTATLPWSPDPQVSGRIHVENGLWIAGVMRHRCNLVDGTASQTSYFATGGGT